MSEQHRTDRVVVYLSPEERTALRRRAHGRPLSTYLRDAVLGPSEADVRDAVDWFHSLPPARQVGVHDFLTSGAGRGRPAVEGETPLPLFDE